MSIALGIVLMLAVTAGVIGYLWQEQREQSDPPVQEEDERISPLLRGINYLLSDKPDQALKELVRVARLQTETAEVYLALGDMFRNKGEFGRAVRIHQNLLARPGLPRDLHIQAQLALAMDFQAGGLLGRALQHYSNVLDTEPTHMGALEASLRIREQGHEWAKAAEILDRIDSIRGVPSSLHHAYLRTEMAREQFEKGETEAALEWVQQAIERNPACAAAYVLLAEIELKHGRVKAAMNSMKRLQKYAPRYIPLLIPILMQDKRIYEDQGKAFLMGCWKKNRDEFLMLEWIKAVGEKFGQEAARELIKETEFTPRGLRACLFMQAMMGGEDALARACREWRRQVKNYLCSHCGVEVTEMRWQCPQCHQWGSMRPIQEGD